MKPLYLDGISLLGPGLPDWEAARPMLRGEADYLSQPLPRPTPTLLPPNERRRVTMTIRLALVVAQEALEAAGRDAAETPSVFASCTGDSEITDRLSRALALPERPVSPTHFHNSVHNAPAGYWAIAVASRAPSTSIAAGPGTFAAALLEALSQIQAERRPVLLAAYDAAPPAPLVEPSGVSESFAAGLVLTPQPGPRSLCELSLELVVGAQESPCEGALETLRLANPAARALPLLAAVADGAGEVVLPYLDGLALRLVVRPC